jgi:hypothetical protein
MAERVRGEAHRLDPAGLLTMWLCLANVTFTICYIRIRDITTRFALTCLCTRTRQCRVRCGQLAACSRCRSWAGYTINIFEFEFTIGTGVGMKRRVVGNKSAGTWPPRSDRSKRG